jgi:hypothetical protein
MSTATARKKKPKDEEEKHPRKFLVKFGDVSIGEETSRVGLTISREFCNVVAADEIFVGHRLTGCITLSKKQDATDEKQETLLDTEYAVSGSFDVTRVGITRKNITTGITFSLNDIDVSDLSHFANKTGYLIVDGVGELPLQEKEVKPHVEGQFAFDGAWRFFPLKKAFKGKILKSLLENGCDNLGLLAEYTKSGKKLVDMTGVGPGMAEEIVRVTDLIYADNPHFKEDEE